MTSDQPTWTAEGVAETLANFGPETLGTDVDDFGIDEWAYLEAAAVLSTFDPASLNPVRPVGGDATHLMRSLLTNSSLVYGGDGKARWRLDDGIRKRALRRLGSRQAMRQACAVNPKQALDELDQVFRQELRAEEVPLSTLRADELSRMIEVSDWLADALVDEVPVVASTVVREAFDQALLLEPFERLAGADFAGRLRELRHLRDYVGVSGGTALGSVVRVFRSALGIRERLPLVITGVGGIGKSTLLAKFILEHNDGRSANRIPFAYLDFDRAGVVADEPTSLLIEAARQLGLQHSGSDWEDLRGHWVSPIRTGGRQIAERRRPGKRVDRKRREDMVEEFAATVHITQPTEPPLLLVLDTFEEVQYSGAGFVDELWSLLDALQSRVPTLRTVVAGRAPLRDHKTVDLQLEKLEDDAAVAFLEHQGIGHRAAERVVARVGGNPLTLKLAAAAIHQDEGRLDSLEEVAKRQKLFRSIDQQLIQGELYMRILRHLHNPRLERLARPGLVLRRVTPEIILEVLAEPSGVEVASLADARSLFVELRREVGIVRPSADGDDVLEHRSDVRRAILRILAVDMPEAIGEIHNAAVKYYSAGDDAVARAEELYHRLARGDDPAEVGTRWRPDAGERLRSAIEELPVQAQAYLASMLGVELPPEVWEHASRMDLVRRTSQRARTLLSYGAPESVLSVLDDVPPIDRGFELSVLEATARRLTQDISGARSAIHRALEADDDPPTAMLLDALHESARVDEAAREIPRAVRTLKEAYGMAGWVEDKSRFLDIAASLLRLIRTEQIDDDASQSLVDQVYADVSALSDQDLLGEPQLLWEVAGLLAFSHPDLLTRMIRLVELPADLPSRDLERFLQAWDEELQGDLAQDPAATGLLGSEDTRELSRRVPRMLPNLLDAHPLTPQAGRILGSILATSMAPSVEGGDIHLVADLHAHYPMHISPEFRGDVSRILGTARGRASWRDRIRAWVMRFASRFLNNPSFGAGPRVTVESLRKGDVRVVLSVLYQPFDEFDLGESYGAAPKATYLSGLMNQLEVVESEVQEHREAGAVVAKGPRELDRAVAEGKIAFVHCVEGGFHIGGRTEDVRRAVAELARHGVAYITLAHLVWRRVATNAPALPFLPDSVYRRLFPQPEEGLSELGRALVEAMVREGVLIDISHMSDRSIDDTFELLDRLDQERRVPVLATHSCFRFGAQEYGLTEKTLSRIKEREGVVGLIMAQHQLCDGLRRNRTRTFDQSFEVICSHIDRIAEVTGSHRYAAIGSDLDGFIKPTMGGLESAADMRKLQQSLLERYGPVDAQTIAAGNALRVLHAGWRGALQASERTPAETSQGA